MNQFSDKPIAAALQAASRDDAEMFDLAPVSLWLEDYSGIKALFDLWRQQGVADIRSHLRQDPRRVAECSERIRVLKVNRKTLDLYEADDLEHLVDNLGVIFRGDMFETHLEELAQIWDGSADFSGQSVNYAISGRRIDIQLRGSILPGYEDGWERVLVAIEDVTERETARRRLATSEEYARWLFEHSPISLWVEDFSTVKQLLDALRQQGISNFRVFTDVHPEFVERCMSEIKVIDVNQHTLDIFAAPNKNLLLNRLGEIFRDDMRESFKEQLIDLWDGKLFQQREVLNYSLAGDEIYLHLQFSVLPGREHDWSLVQVALTDITARKKAEAYLEFLGKHDVLTKLYNRSFYVDELNRLERKGTFPVTAIVADLNGVKQANDDLGHAAGDALLRRFGEVLAGLIKKPHNAARIGGDEFAVLMPGATQEEGQALIEDICRLVEINNQFYGDPKLSFAIGAATSVANERMEAVITRADSAMYASKREYYSNEMNNRRRPDAWTDNLGEG